jgi:hypothetical protein
MATDSIMSGLFGITPEAYQAQENRQALAQSAQLAQQDPFTSARTSLIYAGRQIPNLFGAQDPQLRIISARNAVMQDVDPNNPTSLQSAIQKLSAVGDQAGALQLSDYLRKAQGDYALIQQRTAEKMTPEQRNALAYAASTGAPQNSPEFGQAYQTKLNELITKPEATSTEMKNAYAFAKSKFAVGSPEFNELYSNELARMTTKEINPSIEKVGIAESTREPVYFDKKADQQFIMKADATGKMIRVPYSGGIDQTTAKTRIENKLPEGEKAFDVELGKLDAQAVKDARQTRGVAIDSITALNRLASYDDNALISGFYASGRVGATNLLKTLGLSSETDGNRLAQSQAFSADAGRVALQAMGGKLGAGFSNDDRKFILDLFPRLETDPAARRQLIEYMQKVNQRIVTETTNLENFARINKGLTNKTTGEIFKPTIPLSVSPSGNALQSMSTEQLQQMLKNAK